MIEVHRGGHVYRHPGFATPRELHRFVVKHAEALDAPLIRLAPRLLSVQRDLAEQGTDELAAGYGAVMASAAEVLEVLQGRPSSAMAEALTTDAVYDLVDTVCGACTVDGGPCGNTHAWHVDGDAWGPHIVAFSVVWQAQGFRSPGGDPIATGAAEE